MSVIKLLSLTLLVLLSLQSAHANWMKQNTGSFAWFKDIFFLNEQKGWIVGADGVLLNTDDSGATWLQTKKFTNDDFVQVYFTSEKTGWLLCQRNVYQRGKDPVSYLRKTTNGGQTWDKVEFEDAGRERVTRMVFRPDGTARAFGEGGIFYKLDEDGVTWKKSATAIHFMLLDGGFANDTIGAIVGAGGTILFTEDSGLTWEKATLLGATDTKFNAVFFSEGKSAWAVGNQGRIFRSNGGGRLWRQQISTVTVNLNDVYFTSPTSGWAVGDNGIIVRTRDGGNNWHDVNSTVSHKLEKVVFAGKRGWAVGFGGTLLIYDESLSKDAGAKPVMQQRSH